MDRALSWFVRGWVTLGIVVNVISIIGLLLFEPGEFADRLRVFQHIYSPLNLINWFMELALFSPAIVANWWLKRRQRRAP